MDLMARGEQHERTVEIFKIRLKIWKFRDELEYIISQRLEAAGNDPAQVETSDLEELDQRSPSSSGPLDPLEGEEREGEGEGEPGLGQMMMTREDNVLPMRRTRPQLETGKMADGTLALIDLNMETIACFTTHQYLPGQTIVMEFLVPQRFFMVAEVLNCPHYNRESRVITHGHLNYRLHAKWVDHLPGERSMLKRFLQSVSPTPQIQEAQEDDLSETPQVG